MNHTALSTRNSDTMICLKSAFIAAVIGLATMQPVLAEPVASHEATEPMDENWDNVTTYALLNELTRLAQDLEAQREKNAGLERKLDVLTRRLDQLQSTLAKAGYVPKVPPVEIPQVEALGKTGAIGVSGAEPLDLTSSKSQASLGSSASDTAKQTKEKGYVDRVLDIGGEMVRKVTDW